MFPASCLVHASHDLREGEKYDFFLYAPHADAGEGWLDTVKKGMSNVPCDDATLLSYMRHEADIGTMEMGRGIYDRIRRELPDMKACLVFWFVPRAFCDLNRPFDNACPSIADKGFWREIHATACREIDAYILRSTAGLHLHTMCSRNNTVDWCLTDETNHDDMRYFLENGYSGEPRSDNLLTRDCAKNRISCTVLDSFFKKSWEEQGKRLEENGAYHLKNGNPATELIRHIPSSLIEITKGNIATEETKHLVDSSKIALDPHRMGAYINLVAEGIIEYMQAKQSH